jgi:hypothetical protein
MATLAAGTRVYIGGTAAPIIYSSATQVNALVPFGIAGAGATSIQVEYNGVKGNTITVPVVNSSPGIFSQGYGPGQAWMANQDWTFNSTSNPAPRNTYVAFWATGQGLVDIPQQDGTQPTAPPFPNPLLPVSVSLGGFSMGWFTPGKFNSTYSFPITPPRAARSLWLSPLARHLLGPASQLRSSDARLFEAGPTAWAVSAGIIAVDSPEPHPAC